MRFLIAALACAAAAADEKVFTQLPEVAPTFDDAPVAKQADASFSGAPLPAWIWGANGQKALTLAKDFVLPSAGQARLMVAADNHARVTLDGERTAENHEWSAPTVEKLGELKAGKHAISVAVRDDDSAGGLLLKLMVVHADGSVTNVVTDETWRVAGGGAGPGKKKKAAKEPAVGGAARKLADYGAKPWGNVLENAGQSASAPFKVLPGYRVERLFTVPKDTLGSWVNIAIDDRGRLLASDQGNKGLCRVTPAPVGTKEPTKVERVAAGNISGAQGMVYAFGSLYVVCNGGPGSGLYRLRDTKGDGVYDDIVKLKEFAGGGEHGPHAVRVSPDGKGLWVLAGNHTKPPANFDHSRLPKNWGEDLLLPRQWDAGGHARGILAPGGWLAQTDPEGKTWEILTAGYRNPFDFAFNAEGELFVYDADMEWDMGMPWYRPTRVNHATSGSELGWRSGAGKWPAYYADSLPAAVDLGPGSPVGVSFAYGAKFPAQHQKALLVCDWTFGTIHAIHFAPDGSTYKATREEFLSRTPLPLTDLAVNPLDGCLYFLVGGRGTQSELYRVSYVGNESTAPAEARDGPGAAERAARRALEAFHRPQADPAAAIAAALPALGHPDRFHRYAARLALEHQPAKLWQEQALAAAEPDAAINAVIALARQGDKALLPRLLEKLGAFDLPALDERRQVDVLRAYQLAFTRMGEPAPALRTAVLGKLDGLFPLPSDPASRELCQVLVFLQSPTAVGKAVAFLSAPSRPLTQAGMDELLARNKGYGGGISKMLKNAPDPQKLSYLYTLRNAKAGWTLASRKAYFGALDEALTRTGGSSYQGFLRNISADCYGNATEAERVAIEAAGLRKPFVPPPLPKPQGPGKAWTVADLAALEGKLTGRDFKNGEKMYAATRCVVCHRFAGDGGATGPDLSQVAGRFTLKDLAESLVDPSKVVSDQYRASILQLSDGQSLAGRVVSEVDGKLTVVVDPENASKTRVVAKADVEAIKPSPQSLMPAGLLNTLNEKEAADLLAYLLSRGDPGHAMFKKR